MQNMQIFLSGIAARAIAAAAATYPVAYVLGEGGRSGDAPTPAPDGRLDCSGFAAWCAGLNRLNPIMASASWGTPRLLAGQEHGAKRIQVTGARQGARFVAGEYFRLAGRTYEVRTAVRADAHGCMALSISPGLRHAVPAATALEPLGWLETSAVYQDAIGPQRAFTRETMATPGDFIVWPDRHGGEGHIGVVVAVDGAGKATSVVHCSSGNFKRLGRAIQRTPADVFHRNGAVYARLRFAA